MSTAEKLRPYRFTKGKSGNPGGRPPLPPELRGISSLTQGEVTKLVSKYARMTRDQLQASIQDAGTPVLEMAIASIFAQAIKQGDYTRLSFLFDRAIGKVRDYTEEEEHAVDARADLKVLSTEELLRLVQATTPQLEEKK